MAVGSRVLGMRERGSIHLYFIVLSLLRDTTAFFLSSKYGSLVLESTTSASVHHTHAFLTFSHSRKLYYARFINTRTI